MFTVYVFTVFFFAKRNTHVACRFLARTPSATIFVALVARLVRSIFFSPTFFRAAIEKFPSPVGLFGKTETG